MTDATTHAHQQAAIRAFVRSTFGLRGTLRLHRHAFGADLMRAPINVLLAPILLLVRLLGLLAKLLRLRSASNWLLRRKILLQTNVAKQVNMRVRTLLSELDDNGIGVTATNAVLDHEIAEYTGVRSAVGEITTTILILFAGIVIFQTATPGLISLTGPIAELRAHTLAVEGFPLGQRLGRMYYGVFSTDLTPWQVILTGVALALIASIVATFAGVIADPIQVVTGIHCRRLTRLLRRLTADRVEGAGLAREHITARVADLGDIVLNLWRFIRG